MGNAHSDLAAARARSEAISGHSDAAATGPSSPPSIVPDEEPHQGSSHTHPPGASPGVIAELASWKAESERIAAESKARTLQRLQELKKRKQARNNAPAANTRNLPAIISREEAHHRPVSSEFQDTDSSRKREGALSQVVIDLTEDDIDQDD